MMRKNQLHIDVGNHIYTLNGKDISRGLVGLNIKMEGFEKTVELKFSKPDIVLTGTLITDENLHPLLSDYTQSESENQQKGLIK